ncbi:MAG: hypothetical protein WA002_14895 [Candidatus Acidiferrales bacterium]
MSAIESGIQTRLAALKFAPDARGNRKLVIRQFSDDEIRKEFPRRKLGVLLTVRYESKIKLQRPQGPTLPPPPDKLQ